MSNKAKKGNTLANFSSSSTSNNNQAVTDASKIAKHHGLRYNGRIGNTKPLKIPFQSAVCVICTKCFYCSKEYFSEINKTCQCAHSLIKPPVLPSTCEDNLSSYDTVVDDYYRARALAYIRAQSCSELYDFGPGWMIKNGELVQFPMCEEDYAHFAEYMKDVISKEPLYPSPVHPLEKIDSYSSDDNYTPPDSPRSRKPYPSYYQSGVRRVPAPPGSSESLSFPPDANRPTGRTADNIRPVHFVYNNMENGESSSAGVHGQEDGRFYRISHSRHSITTDPSSRRVDQFPSQYENATYIKTEKITTETVASPRIHNRSSAFTPHISGSRSSTLKRKDVDFQVNTTSTSQKFIPLKKRKTHVLSLHSPAQSLPTESLSEEPLSARSLPTNDDSLSGPIDSMTKAFCRAFPKSYSNKDRRHLRGCPPYTKEIISDSQPCMYPAVNDNDVGYELEIRELDHRELMPNVSDDTAFTFRPITTEDIEYRARNNLEPVFGPLFRFCVKQKIEAKVISVHTVLSDIYSLLCQKDLISNCSEKVVFIRESQIQEHNPEYFTPKKKFYEKFINSENTGEQTFIMCALKEPSHSSSSSSNRAFNFSHPVSSSNTDTVSPVASPSPSPSVISVTSSPFAPSRSDSPSSS